MVNLEKLKLVGMTEITWSMLLYRTIYPVGFLNEILLLFGHSLYSIIQYNRSTRAVMVMSRSLALITLCLRNSMQGRHLSTRV